MNSLPPLTSLRDEDEMKAHSFSPYANWLIPNLVMVGESPAANKKSTRKRIRALCKKAGCGTFVCLQSEVPPQTCDALDMGGYKDWKKNTSIKRLPSYCYHVAKALPDKKPLYIHYGMRGEDQVHSLSSLNVLVEELKRHIISGEVLYIHCHGGNGRANIVAAGLLGQLYSEIGAKEALQRTQKYYETRHWEERKELPLHGNFLDTEGQEKQIEKLFELRFKPTMRPSWPMSVREESKEEESKEKDSDNVEFLDKIIQIKDRLTMISMHPWSKPSREEERGGSELSTSMETQDTVDQKRVAYKSYLLSCSSTKSHITLSMGLTTHGVSLLIKPMHNEFIQPYHSYRVQQIKNKLRPIEVQYCGATTQLKD